MTVTAAGTEPAGVEAPPARKISTAVWIALGVVYVLWGSTYLAIRYAIESIPPFTSAAVRFVLAGLVLLGFLGIRGGFKVLRVSRRELASAAAVGVLLLVAGNGGVVLSERTLPSGMAALLVASVPLWVVLWRVFAGDRPTARTLVGVLLGFVGLAVLILPGGHSATHGSYALGVFFVVLASLSWSFGSVAGKAWWKLPENPFVASGYEMLAGGIGCAIAAVVHGEHAHVSSMSGRSIAAVGYLIVFGSLVAFSAYVWLLHTAPISLVATYAYVNPMVAVALGALFLNEPVTAAVVLGGLIVVAGVAVVIATERK